MRKVLIRFRRVAMFVAIAFACFTSGLLLVGCGSPVWLTDAASVLALAGSSFASIASFIAGLTGNVALAAALAIVSTWITEVQSGITDLQTLISQYQATPNATLLQSIEAGLADVQANAQKDFSNLGLPTSILGIIAGIAGVAVTLLTQWSALFQGVATATTAAEYRTASHKLADALENLPQAKKAFADQVNAILNTKTGDAKVDAALAKATRVTV